MERSGCWMGFLSYDLGRAVERVATTTTDDRGIPDLAFARFDARARVAPQRAGAAVTPSSLVISRRTAGATSVPSSSIARITREEGLAAIIVEQMDSFASGEPRQMRIVPIKTGAAAFATDDTVSKSIGTGGCTGAGFGSTLLVQEAEERTRPDSSKTPASERIGILSKNVIMATMSRLR